MLVDVVGIFSQCICASNHQVVYFKYITDCIFQLYLSKAGERIRIRPADVCPPAAGGGGRHRVLAAAIYLWRDEKMQIQKDTEACLQVAQLARGDSVALGPSVF